MNGLRNYFCWPLIRVEKVSAFAESGVINEMHRNCWPGIGMVRDSALQGHLGAGGNDLHVFYKHCMFFERGSFFAQPSRKKTSNLFRCY